LPDAGRIRFWGNRKDPELFLAAADGMISVSREESSPNALVEGLWFGVPIAASRCAGVEELVNEAAGGLLVEDSEEGEGRLADWISRHPTERTDRKAAAEQYREKARRRFDPSMRADEYIRLFEGLGNFPS
jgi:glycosyltransferase involved in cell wall biosynthesis